MTEKIRQELTTSDELLVEQTRAGDQRAFAELWRRHFRSGARVARQFTSSLDADDLVSEAYTRIYQRVLAGGGPTGAFRPYLYTTIRNLASSWGAASKDVQVDDIADFEDPTTLEDPAAFALDRTLTARAFRSLPDRWQSVLWYTEVEGMDPHEVGPLMGMTANGVAALSYRAREGLRKAWLQAHISDATGFGECQWVISRVGDHARNGLTDRDSQRMRAHLQDCAKCAIISEEVDEVGSRLAIVMFPILLGGVAGGAFLASFGSAAGTATAAAIPALPAAVTAGGSTVGAGAAGGIGAGAAGVVAAGSAPVLVSTLAIAVVLTGAVVVASPASIPAEQTSYSAAEVNDTAGPTGSTSDDTAADLDALSIDDPAHIPQSGVGPLLDGVGGTVGGVVDGVGGVVDGVVGGVGGVVGDTVDGVGGVVDDVVEPVVEAVIPEEVATVDISLSGRAIPGATVSASVAGQVYTTVAASDGRFSFSLAGLPGGTTTVQLSQSGGLLGVLGLVVPISLDSGTLGIVFSLLN